MCPQGAPASSWKTCGPRPVHEAPVSPGQGRYPGARARSGRVQADLHVFPILHIALELARLLHTKYAGTPVATIPRPIKACTGRATIVFPTIAAAAAMNSAGVTG